jgi:transcription-repair coupling factor (superfamily II helicase)
MRKIKLLVTRITRFFERYHKFSIKNSYSKKQKHYSELTTLAVGDYVTHIDHGIGRFGGLQKIQVENRTQEAIKLVYADNDIVYVSIHSLHKISKYAGKDRRRPKFINWVLMLGKF